MHGTQTFERLDTSLPPPAVVERAESPAEPGGRRRWPSFAIVGGLVLALAAGFLGGRLSQQSEIDDLTDERDGLSSEVIGLRAERDGLAASIEDLEAAATDDAATIAGLTGDLASEEALNATLQEDQAALTTDLAAERVRVASLSSANEELRTTLEEVREVAEAIVYMDLNFNSSGLEAMVSDGIDVKSLEAILEELGHDTTIEEWAASWDDWDGAWRQADSAVVDTGDDVLIETWDRWNGSTLGSEEEANAYNDVWVRAFDLLLERSTILE